MEQMIISLSLLIYLEVKARIKAIIRRNRRKTPAVQEEPKVIVSGKHKIRHRCKTSVHR